MDLNRCTRCNKRLKLVLDAHNRTEFLCLHCDEFDPLNTDAVKWANSPLAGSACQTEHCPE